MTVQLDSQQKSVFEKVLNTTLKECLEPLIWQAKAANRHIRTLRKEGKTNAAVFIEREAQAEVLLGAEHALIGFLAGLEKAYGLDLGGAKAKSERIFEKIFDNTKKICAGSDRETTDRESRDAMGKSTPERDAFMQAAAHAWEQISALPEDQQPAAIEKAMSGFNAVAQCQALPKPEKGEQTPDLSGIPQWRGRKRDGMPLDFLETHYGEWLEAFGAERDSVFQDHIRAHDSKLIQGLHNQFYEEGKGRKVHDFIKPYSARTDQELEAATVEDLKKNPRLAANAYTRSKRAAEAACDISP